MPKYKRIGLSFHEWDIEKLDKVAKMMGENRSRAIVRLVDFYLRYKNNVELSTSEIMDTRELFDSIMEKSKKSAMDE
jgi:metal-responsive CopG/Arc/MetJ family transcriptional regulator